jgi:predicted HTH transcriptional regulator
MYRRGRIDSQGSGTLRMLNEAQVHQKWPPEIVDTHHSVRVVFTRDGHLPLRYQRLQLSEVRRRMLAIIGTLGPVAPAEITARTGPSSVTVSQHLRALLDAGLVERTGKSQQTRYSIR